MHRATNGPLVRRFILALLCSGLFSTASHAQEEDCLRELGDNPKVVDAINCFKRELDRMRSAVVAFDIREGCPQGWSPFLHTAGRFIIGAGDPTLSKLREDDNGEPLKERIFSLPGGSQLHKLTIDEMPSHSHEVLLSDSSGGGSGIENANNNSRGGVSNKLARTGGGQGHNNMPPYIALYYCKKD